MKMFFFVSFLIVLKSECNKIIKLYSPAQDYSLRKYKNSGNPKLQAWIRSSVYIVLHYTCFQFLQTFGWVAALF